MPQKNPLTREELKVFETVPDLYLILSPDLHILTASNAYLSATLTLRQEIVGRHLFEVFPDNPETPEANSVKNLYASLIEVLTKMQTHQMKLQRYDVPRPSALGGGFEEKYWKPTNTPVLDELGEVRYIIHKVSDVTKQISDHRHIQDLTDREQAALAEADWQQKRLIDFFMQAPVAIGIFEGKEHVIGLANPLMCKILGRDSNDLLGKPFFNAMPELKGQGFDAILSQVYNTGKPFEFEESPATFLMHNGKLEEGFYHTVYQPLMNVQGEITGIINIVTDVSEQVKARKKLEESENRFRTLLESIPQMAWTNLPDGSVNFYNKRCHEYTGLSFNEIYGWGWQPLVHPDDLDKSLIAYKGALETGNEFIIENRLKRHDGHYRWHLNRSIPIQNETGEVILCVGTSTDIHEQKLLTQQLLESEQYFRMMADNVPAMIWVTDPDGQCTYLNKQWYDFTGQTEEIGLGLGWLKAVHPDDTSNTANIFLNANAKQIPFDLTYRLKSESGDYRWAIDVGLPKFDAEGKFEGFVGAVYDIHERKLAEERLHQMSQELVATNDKLIAANEQIQASNEDLAHTNQQLSYINADMDNFIYTASHDLRAPITNIEGLMDTLMSTLSDESRQSPMINKLSGMITSSIERFKNTLNDLTEITKVQREGKVEDLVEINLTKVISEVQLDLSQQIEEAEAQFDLNLKNYTPIRFSPKNARSIVYNLISNAIKYRSPQRQVLIRISCSIEDNYLVLSVSDNGLGMDLSDESKIFAMFKRLHDHVDGTGIGLYIVKKIIENAGGKIEVRSKLGQGTTFNVYFKQNGSNKYQC
ncbi:PAS domain S-box-containing protein [Catalinimonas alkaloidigena]|uniref:PAS domain-containing sensor histidine kinase n=1 Tax=Catalinimonas alkaloidigena TaxID=1075417 RepID=UPI002406ED26|nr:PAS domain S-box protein [Catalinimonas alkaloidigena]MDF9797269.1 PAS domain S-box-containing protein [Catalinimonas alkaloidigena]